MENKYNEAFTDGREPKRQLPPDFKEPPLFDENGKRIEYGKNGCPKGRDLSNFKCPCHFPKCV